MGRPAEECRQSRMEGPGGLEGSHHLQYRSTRYYLSKLENWYTNFLITGCQDIDDALHAHRLANGNIEAGVRKYFSFLLVDLTPS